MREVHGEAANQRRQLHLEGRRLVCGPLLVDPEERLQVRERIEQQVHEHRARREVGRELGECVDELLERVVELRLVWKLRLGELRISSSSSGSTSK